jgi:hypothetical protein
MVFHVIRAIGFGKADARSVGGGEEKIRMTRSPGLRRSLYPNKLKNWPIGGFKATNFNNRKRHCIVLIQCRLRLLKFVSFQSRLSANFSVYLGIIGVLLILILGTVFFLIPQKNQCFQTVLKSMTAEEHYYLDAFLRNVLLIDHFAYVLFGNKPVACACYEKTMPSFNWSFDCVSLSRLNTRKGLEVFKKYRNFFSSRKIAVLINDYPDCTDVIVINRKILKKIFEKHRLDFEKILEKKMTSEEFLTQIEMNGDFGKAIHYHEALLGILLGYGGGNAWLFHHMKTALIKMREFEPSSLKNWDLLEKEFTKLNGQLSGFEDIIIKETSWIKKKRIPLPGFRADLNSLETMELKKIYEQDREKLQKILFKPTFIDIVFRELIDA